MDVSAVAFAQWHLDPTNADTFKPCITPPLDNQAYSGSDLFANDMQRNIPDGMTRLKL